MPLSQNAKPNPKYNNKNNNAIKNNSTIIQEARLNKPTNNPGLSQLP